MTLNLNTQRKLTDEELETLEKLTIVRHCRLSVLRFARAMEDVLRPNDYKGGWAGCDLKYLNSRLKEELKEYFQSTRKEDKANEIIDVANFCMMVHENLTLPDEERDV